MPRGDVPFKHDFLANCVATDTDSCVKISPRYIDLRVCQTHMSFAVKKNEYRKTPPSGRYQSTL